MFTFFFYFYLLLKCHNFSPVRLHLLSQLSPPQYPTPPPISPCSITKRHTYTLSVFPFITQCNNYSPNRPHVLSHLAPPQPPTPPPSPTPTISPCSITKWHTQSFTVFMFLAQCHDYSPIRPHIYDLNSPLPNLLPTPTPTPILHKLPMLNHETTHSLTVFSFLPQCHNFPPSDPIYYLNSPLPNLLPTPSNSPPPPPTNFPTNDQTTHIFPHCLPVSRSVCSMPLRTVKQV